MICYDIFLENAKKHQSINGIFRASNQEHIKNTDNWDSLAHVLIVINICDAFSLKFDEDIIPELTSIRKIYNFIKENKK